MPKIPTANRTAYYTQCKYWVYVLPVDSWRFARTLKTAVMIVKNEMVFQSSGVFHMAILLPEIQH